MKTEATRLDEEVSEMRRRNEEEKLSIQDLEMALIKRRRRAEKCRRLAEAQSSYKTMLEKMIRDAMHQYDSFTDMNYTYRYIKEEEKGD